MKIKINFDKLCYIIPYWTWEELKFGLEKNIISNEDIISYAKTIIDDNIDKFDLVLSLCIAYDYEVRELLEELCLNTKFNNENLEKWIFACVYYIFTYENDNIYDKIEDLYCEFDYPNELVDFLPTKFLFGETRPEDLEKYIDEGNKKYNNHYKDDIVM